jgi:hypothetical protein
MPGTLSDEILKGWHRLLQEVELAKNCHRPYLLNGFGSTFRNPLLDFLLPSLLYIKMVAIFDEALTFLIDDRSLTMPKKYKKSLYGRLEFLNDQGIILKYSALHDVRDSRNLLAHEASGTVNWVKLDTDLQTVEAELQHLGFVGERPAYKYFGERSAMRACDEPGVAFAQDFRFGIKCSDQVTMEVTFTKKTYKSGE